MNVLLHLILSQATSAPAVTAPPAGYKSGWLLPPQASTVAPQIDFVFNVITWVCIAFFVGMMVFMFAFMGIYRRRTPGQKALSQNSHNTALELTWSIIPTIILCYFFWVGFTGFVNLTTPPADAYEVQVTAQQWSWAFTYPNGHTDANLHVPAGTPIRLLMRSNDVLHNLFVPAFRTKYDIIPGRYTREWFTVPPEHVGEYPLVCAEYCGKDHSAMYARVVVHPAAEFPIWLDNADPLKRLKEEEYAQYKTDPDKFIAEHPEYAGLETPVKVGEKVHSLYCRSCHTLDGSASTGPTWKGIWGRPERVRVTATGQEADVTVDENYVLESVEDPGQKVVKGFENVMPTFKGRLYPRQIDSLIAYMKTLK